MRSGTGPRHTLTVASNWRAGVLAWGSLAVIAVALVGLSTRDSAAQGTVVIGGDGKPNVEVDLGVIEALGRPSGPLGMRPWLGHVGSTDSNTPLHQRLSPASGLVPASGAIPTNSTSRLTLTPPRPAPRAAPVPSATRAPAPKIPLAAPKAPPVTAQQRIVTPPAPTKRPVTALAATTATIPPPPPPTAPARPTTIAKPPAATKSVASQSGLPPPAAVQKTPSRVAALPRAVDSTAVDQPLQLKFTTESSSLSPDAEERLRALAGELSGDTARLELKAYAGEADRTASAARRLSLSRALAVRSFLIEQGIRSTRIGVRAFGFPTDGGPSERVDVVLLAR